MKKILMLVSWRIHYLATSNGSLQPPDFVTPNEKYWFFRYWPEQNIQVDVLDVATDSLHAKFEKEIIGFHMLQGIRAFITSRNYDLIICHGAQSALFLAFLRSVFGKRLPPYLVIDVSAFNRGRNSIFEIASIRLAARSIDYVVYHAKIQKEHYGRHLPFLLERSKYVPFGADQFFFRPLEVKKGNYILSIGHNWRDWDTLVKAFRELKTDFHLKIIGDQNISIPKEISSRVNCLPYVKINDLKMAMAKAAFIVLPLPYFPHAYAQMTLLQSMAMGKAVVVSRAPGIIDYVTDNENALLVEPSNILDLKSKMEYLLAEPEKKKVLETKARETIEREFNEVKMAQGIYEAVFKII